MPHRVSAPRGLAAAFEPVPKLVVMSGQDLYARSEPVASGRVKVGFTNYIVSEISNFMSTQFDPLRPTAQELHRFSNLYNYEYFNGPHFLRNNLRLDDMMSAVCYAHDITRDQLLERWPTAGDRDNSSDEILDLLEQRDFILQNAKRIPKKILEIGGGAGVLANALKFMSIPIDSIEIGIDAPALYRRSAELIFGDPDQAVQPINESIDQAMEKLDLSQYDTMLIVETIEHIPEQIFERAWDRIIKNFQGYFIITNHVEQHPIMVENEYHCRAVNNQFYNDLSAQAKRCVFRHRSHLVLEF